jgi:ABC-type branched-subunit amino acid transport system substrate-binding protein
MEPSGLSLDTIQESHKGLREGETVVFGGTLDEIGVGHLIQIYCTGRQTACLTVTYPDAEGKLYFENGELVHAELGSLSGVEAVQSAIARKGGQFRVDMGVHSPGRTIDQHWSSVVLNAMMKAESRGTAVPRPAVAAGTASPLRRPPAPVPSPRPSRVLPDREAGAASSVVSIKAPVRAASPVTPPRVVPERQAARDLSRRNTLIGIGAGVAVVAAALAWFLSRPSRNPPPVIPPAKPRNPVITLGMSAALTGPAKELGRQMKLGIETALDLANDAGGISGHKFALVALDDGYEPDRTRETMKDLVESRKVFAVIGNVGTPTAEVSVPYILEKKVLFFGAFTGAGLLRKEPPDRYVLNYRASYAEETAAAVKYLVEIRKIKPNQIAVFAQQDGFGDAGFAGVTKALRHYGRGQDQILRVGFKRNTLEISDAVDEIVKNMKTIQAIVIVAPYRPAAKFIEKLRERQFTGIFTNVSFVGSTALAEELRQLGPKYSAGVIVTQVVPPVDSASTALIQYRDSLAHYFPGEKPDYVSLEGYISASILLEGFRHAGKEPTTENLINGLESIHGLDIGIGTPINYGLSEHQGSHKVWGTVLDENANYHVLDLE